MNALLIEEAEDNFSGESGPPAKVVKAGTRGPKRGQRQAFLAWLSGWWLMPAPGTSNFTPG